MLFAGLVVVLTGVGVRVWQTGNQFVRDSAWVKHTVDVKSATLAIRARLGVLHAAALTYTLTGKPELAADFQAQSPQLDDDVHRLSELVVDNPEQLARVRQLAEAAVSRRDALAKLIADRANTLPPELQSLALDVRRIGTDVLAEEDRLLALRERTVRSGARTNNVLTALAIVLSIGGVAFAFLLVRSNQRRLESGHAALSESHDRLQVALLESETLSETMRQLAQLGELLQACHSLDELRETARTALPSLLPDLGGRLALTNPSQNLLAICAHWGQHGVIAESVFAPEDCWAIRRGHAYPVGDGSPGLVCKHVHWPNPDLPQAGYLCIPLAAQGDTIGVLTLDGAAAPTEAQRRIASAIGEQLALATANLRLQETLRTQSVRDALTGLFNRRYLEVSLEREVMRATRRSAAVAVLMLDVDHFKTFNDTHGHDAGDALLAQLADALRQATRSEDIVCRYGGEEFTVVLPEIDPASAEQRAEHIRATVQTMHVVHREQHLPRVTISIGLALFPIDAQEPADLLRRADSALYRAKKLGRNQVARCGSELAPQRA